MYCEKCGVENKDGARFCKSCGNPLQNKNVETQKPKKVSERKKRSMKWKILAIIILLLAVVAGICLAKKVIKEKKARDYQDSIAQAEKYMEDMDYENAEDLYMKAIKIDPKQKEAYLRLADILVTQEKYDKAIEILGKAEEIVDSANTGRNGENGRSEEYLEISQRKQEIADRVEYSWVVEPTIEADDINYVTDTGYYDKSRNGICMQYPSPYAVIQNEDTMGLIEMDSTMKGGMDYQNISCFTGSSYILQGMNSEDGQMNEYDSWNLYLLQNDEIELALGIGDGDPATYAFYWCDGLYQVDDGYSWSRIVLDKAIPVRQSNQLFSEDDGDALSWWLSLEGKYAVCKDGQLTTDFIYDKCGSSSEGLLAVCQNGKWGYINEDGEIIIPLEYDASWEKTIDSGIGNFSERQPTEEYCYAASEGCIPLVKDGKWELRDTDGDLLILPGVFEAIRPVYDGKCWVKKNGKWGVIALESVEKM